MTCLRYFTVYGPRQRPDMAFHRMFEAVLGRGPGFVRRGDGSQRREFTYVGDVVRATMAAGFAPEGADRTFDVGGGAPASLNDVLDRVGAMAGVPVPITTAPAPAGDPPVTNADLRAITSALGWVPLVRIDEGLRAQWAWHRQPDRSDADGEADGTGWRADPVAGGASGSALSPSPSPAMSGATARQAATATATSTTSHSAVSP